jgi:hypothetical protein
VKKLVSGANVLQPVRFPQMTEPPVPLTIVVNYCGIPTATAAKLAEIVTYLVSLGADPEGKMADGSNLYDRAKQRCPPEVVKAMGG